MIKDKKIKPMNKFLDTFLSKSTIAITLCPFGIYTRRMDKTTLTHEKIHWQQQVEMLILFFYIWYLIEWFIKLFIYKQKAYYHISFEKEAYKYEINETYLSERKLYSWIKYIRNEKN